MQYWTPASTHYVDAETYEGWDSTSGNIWREDRSFDPVWVHRVPGNLGFARGLQIHECEFLCYRLQILRLQWSVLKRKMMVVHPLFVVEEGAT